MPTVRGMNLEKPKKRGELRLFLGRNYFTFRRLLLWKSGKFNFAGKASECLPCICTQHSTPLLRKLKDVDMRLQYNKILNLRLAVAELSGVTLHPGETFSYWKLIGKPSRRKGYVNGMVLKSGSFTEGIGGGLCQLSNMIYWMALHTPLTIIERHRHSYDVFPDVNRTQPFGSGATCSYNYMDLMIRNDTDQDFQLQFQITEQELQGRILIEKPPAEYYEIYEKDHHIDSEYWGGYTRNNQLYRKSFNEQGIMTADEFITENHALMMYSPFLEECQE